MSSTTQLRGTERTGAGSGWTWIVSPRWDLSYLVLPPLAVVPIVTWLSRNWFTTEQISLVVISFASLGHHLPGFLRAYGDSDLFRRYRWRFLLAPPIAFFTALLFTPPEALRAALGLPWTHLHGLELLLLFWGTWHGLMQTYGLMRIYDVRAGSATRWSTRLDHALCLLMFAAGVAFSDSRVFGIGQVMAAAGLPVPTLTVLTTLRVAIAAAGGLVLALYAWQCAGRLRSGEPLNLTKLLLAGVTGWFYWYCGSVTVNIAVGIAMFEIYHALQYNAIVWFYSRKRYEKAGGRFGPLDFLFSDRHTMLCLYLAAIAAYGSLRLFSGASEDYLFAGSSGDASQWLLAWFVASSMLHFYFDGFIWRVSEKPIQQNLVDGPTLRHALAERKDSLFHVGKSLLLLGVVWALLIAGSRTANDVAALVEKNLLLSELTPELPEVQSMLARKALAQGDAASAAEHARRGLANRPHNPELLDHLGAALLQSGDLSGARDAYRRLAEMEPGSVRAVLGGIAVLLAEGEAEPAVERAQELAAEHPGNWRTHNALGGALGQVGRLEEAHAAYRKAAELAPLVGEPFFQQGVLLLRAGDATGALEPLREAVRLEPDRHDTHLLLGNALLALGKREPALAELEHAWRLRPGDPDVAVNLGAVLAQTGEPTRAEEVYRQGLTTRPGSANLHFNLGLLLGQQGRVEEAKSSFEQAEANGLELPVEIKQALSE